MNGKGKLICRYYSNDIWTISIDFIMNNVNVNKFFQ